MKLTTYLAIIGYLQAVSAAPVPEPNEGLAIREAAEQVNAKPPPWKVKFPPLNGFRFHH